MTPLHRLALALAVATSLSATGAAAAPAQTTTPPTIVTFTFDDALPSQLQVAPWLEAKGMAGTFYVNSNKVEHGTEHMTWAQVHALAAAGHEIGGHGLDHVAVADDTDPATPPGDPAEHARQVCEDRANLVARGFPATSFAYPTGRWDEAAKQIVKNCGYTSGRTTTTWNQDPKYPPLEYAETLPPAEPFAFRAETVMAKLGSTHHFLRDITQWSTDHGGGWINLVIHDVCTRPCRSAEEFEWSADPEHLRLYIDWLASARGKAEAVVMTTGEVMEMLNGPTEPPAACENGTDDDGDGKVDAADPGCETPGDGDETDPPPPDPEPEPGPQPEPDPEPEPEPQPTPAPTTPAAPVAPARKPAPAPAETSVIPPSATAPLFANPLVLDRTSPKVKLGGLPKSRTVTRRARRVLTIRAFALDDVRSVRAKFYLDGKLAAVDRRAPFTMKWRTWLRRKGLHRVTVRVYDAAGNSGGATSRIRIR